MLAVQARLRRRAAHRVIDGLFVFMEALVALVQEVASAVPHASSEKVYVKAILCISSG